MNMPTEAETQRWGNTLRGVGLRVTLGRIAALHFVDAHPHVSVGQIHSALVNQLPSLSAQSVHNITNDLAERGILRRIDLPDTSSALFETRVADNHHHIQCIVCRRIEDIECVIGEAPCLAPGHAHGMRLIEAAVTFRGLCAECDPG